MSLRELAPGTGLDGQGTPALDIVAVHGLNPINRSRHAFNTWQKPEEETGHLWLKDAFPIVQPNARIHLYEYNSSPVFGAGKDTFVQEANQLLDEIYGARWPKGQNIPIILIGHSLGGLLIKQALVNAWANEKYRCIQTSTYGLIFFGTPHTGPGNNPEARLGRTCAKIARSLPGTQYPNLLETLERGSLFSDFLREAFRHQLETYKILSCYEGVGDIVPFESAVMNLPGNRETQLRINADHSNMCRFDPLVSVDRDNYRKVERNLQMLCTDALVGSLGDDEAKGSSQTRQGGIDLGSKLLEGVPQFQTNISIPMTIRFSEVPDLAYSVYRSCIQSSSSPEFARAAVNVSSLHTALRMTLEILESDTFSKDLSGQVRLTYGSCFEALQDLQTAVDKFKALPNHSQISWSRMGFELSNFAEIEQRLQSTISMVTDLNQTLSSGSMNRLVEKLNNLVDEIESGEAAASIVSSYVSGLSQPTNMHDEESWTLLRRELENSGLSSTILAEQREFICKWILNAAEAGRLQLEDPLPEVEAAGNGSIVPFSVPQEEHLPEPEATDNGSIVPFSTLVEQANPSTEATASNIIKTGWSTSSLVRLLRYGVLRRKEHLRDAVTKGDLAMVRELLKFKIPIDAEDEDETVVEIAARKCNVEMMKLLLDQGSTTFKYRKLYYVNKAMEISVQRDNWEAVEVLLARGSSYKFGPYSIMEATGNISTQALRKMRESWGREEIDKSLLSAASSGNMKLLQFLVEEGADVNAKTDSHARAALHFAAANCDTEIMKFLLDKGADIEVRDASGDTPLLKIPCASDGIGRFHVDGSGERIPYRKFSPKHSKAQQPWLYYTIIMTCGRTVQFKEIYDEDSVSSSEPGIALQLLLDKGADIKAKDYAGQTAVHKAAIFNEDLIMKILLYNDVDIEAIDNSGNTALHAAIAAGNIQRQKFEAINWDDETKTKVGAVRWNKKVASRLLKSKANVNAQNFAGKTSLHLACRYEQGGPAELLLENGANVNAVDHRNWTPLHCAVDNGSMPVVLILLRYGALTNIGCLPDRGSKRITAIEMARLKGFYTIAQVLEGVSTG